jgi:hypothetical protein
MISSVAPALLSASTIAVNIVRSVIGNSPNIPTGARDRRLPFGFTRREANAQRGMAQRFERFHSRRVVELSCHEHVAGAADGPEQDLVALAFAGIDDGANEALETV